MIGEEFVCADCGEKSRHTKTHADMVCEYEILTGREYDPREPLVYICDECEKLYKEAEWYKQPVK